MPRENTNTPVERKETNRNRPISFTYRQFALMATKRIAENAAADALAVRDNAIAISNRIDRLVAMEKRREREIRSNRNLSRPDSPSTNGRLGVLTVEFYLDESNNVTTKSSLKLDVDSSTFALSQKK